MLTVHAPKQQIMKALAKPELNALCMFGPVEYGSIRNLLADIKIEHNKCQDFHFACRAPVYIT